MTGNNNNEKLEKFKNDINAIVNRVNSELKNLITTDSLQSNASWYETY